MELVCCAGELGNVEHWEVAIDIVEAVLRRFGEDTDPRMRLPLALALQAKALAQGKLGRHEEAIATYQVIAQRFGGEEGDPLALRKLVAQSLLYRAARQFRVGRLEDCLDSMSEVVRRFGEAEDLSLLLLVLRALDVKGKALADIQRHAEALEAFDELLARSIGATEAPVLDHVAWALVRKASAFMLLGEFDYPRPLLEEVIERFADSTEPGQRAAVAHARRMMKGYEAIGGEH